MRTTEDTAIRERAYHIWESAGRPYGRAEEHWHQAMQEAVASPPMTTPERLSKARKATTRKAANGTKKAAAKREATAK
ncbi:MAG: DUF2934 domain-containing protein [Alphaproteobacteria bacterium]